MSTQYKGSTSLPARQPVLPENWGETSAQGSGSLLAKQARAALATDARRVA